MSLQSEVTKDLKHAQKKKKKKTVEFYMTKHNMITRLAIVGDEHAQIIFASSFFSANMRPFSW